MIPDELKARDQWLLWSRDSDPAKAPLTADGYNASWTDPASWLSYKEAEQLADENEEFGGVGFVIAENDPYIGLDLDGVLTEANQEKTKDWVPPLEFVSDTWAEYSGGGFGVHVITKGDRLPGWWSDSHFSDEEHEGVEAYTEKFFALTGNKIEFAAEKIGQTDVSPFLASAYEAINGEPPRLPGSNSKPESDVDLHIYDVLSRSSYPKGENTSHPFHPSETGTNFRVDPGGETFRCWRHGVTGNAAHLLGIEQDVISCGDWANGGLSADTWREIFDAGREAGYDIPTPQTADGGAVTKSTRTAEPGRERMTISRQTILTKAGRDPDEDELEDLAQYELAHIIAELIPKADDYHFRWSETVDDDEPIVWGYSDGLWFENGMKKMRMMLRGALGAMNTKRLMNKVKHSFTSIGRAEIHPDEMGTPEGTVAVENGLLHLLEHGIEGEAISELQPDHLAIRKLPTEYDNDAEHQDTLFMELLQENVRDERDLKRLQEYAGYTLWHHDQPFGKALFLIGPTDSGKSLFLKVLKGVLGQENVATETMRNLLESRWGFAQLYGNLANIRNEVTAEGLNNVEHFKELTGGGDRVTAEYKNGRKFSFTVTQKFLFATNQIPSLKHAGDPFFNRLLFVQFPETVPEREQIKDAKERILENESSAVLNWMLDGLSRLMEQEHFTGERSIEEKKDVSNSWGGLIDRFTHNVIEITGEQTDVVHKKKLFGLFDDFANWVGQANELQQQTFTKELKTNAGITDGRSSRVEDLDDDQPLVFKGIRVKKEALEELGVDHPPHAYGEPGKQNGDQSRLTD